MTIPFNKLPWFEWLGPFLKSWSLSVSLPPQQPPKHWENDLNQEEILFENLRKTVEVSDALPEFAIVSTYCHRLKISKFLFVPNSQKSNLIWPLFSNLSNVIDISIWLLLEITIYTGWVRRALTVFIVSINGVATSSNNCHATQLGMPTAAMRSDSINFLGIIRD